MVDDFGCSISHAHFWAMEFFLGSNQNGKNSGKSRARRAAKYDPNKTPEDLAKNSWNLAWDMTMARSVEFANYGQQWFSEPVPALLASMNEDPDNVSPMAKILLTAEMIQGGNTHFLNVSPKIDPKHRTILEIESESRKSMTLSEIAARGRRLDGHSILELAASHIEELEVQLGVARSKLS